MKLFINSSLFFFLLSFNLLLANENFEEDQSEEETTESSEKILTEEDFIYVTPDLEQDKYYIFEHFDDKKQYLERWFKSLTSKSDSKESKYDGQWDYSISHPKLKGDFAITMSSKARHHAISSKLIKKFEFTNKPLVLQYEIKFQNGQECGGAYIKLLTAPVRDLTKVNEATPYTIMFGPDKCGNDIKLHFIFKHKHPKNGSLREIHFDKANTFKKMADIFKDNKWHIFRLTIKPDNSFEINMDKKVLYKGSLLEDFKPSVNPPKEIDDENDKKPEDWDEREKIPDPDAKKPSDWDETQPRKIIDETARIPEDWLEDEEELIPDKSAKKPDNWDVEIDGEWEPPMINNPKCAKVSGCGKWKAPLIDNPKFKGKWKPSLIQNPNFKGKWTPKKIKNPDYFNDKFPFKMSAIDTVAFELWTISDGISFDNVLITDNVDVANYVLDHTYQFKKEISDAETDNWFVKMIKETNKKPWLWIIYLMVVAIPVILFIGYCCVNPGRKNNQSDKEESSKLNTENDIADPEIEEIEEIEEVEEVEEKDEEPPKAEPRTRMRKARAKRED